MRYKNTVPLDILYKYNLIPIEAEQIVILFEYQERTGIRNRNRQAGPTGSAGGTGRTEKRQAGPAGPAGGTAKRQAGQRRDQGLVTDKED